jgi:hypothetical protein
LIDVAEPIRTPVPNSRAIVIIFLSISRLPFVVRQTIDLSYNAASALDVTARLIRFSIISRFFVLRARVVTSFFFSRGRMLLARIVSAANVIDKRISASAWT